MITGEIGIPEPEYLPSLLPYGLYEGSSGIGVGLASDVVTVNLIELIDYYIDYIRNDKFNKDLTPKPDFGACIVNLSDEECIDAVNSYQSQFPTVSLIKQESDNVFVIESLYGKRIEVVLNKLSGYINSDKVDFRDESKTSQRYVFEIMDNSVDPNKFKNDLESATSKRTTFKRAFVDGDKSLFVSLNYVIKRNLEALNKAIDLKLKKERELYIERSRLLRVLMDIKNNTKIFNNLTRMKIEDVIDEIISIKDNLETGDEIDENIIRSILKKPISYLTRSHDSEIEELNKSISEIDNHNRKDYLISMYEQLKDMIRPIFESKKHTILKSQIMVNPKAGLTWKDGKQYISVSDKLRGGIRFTRYIYLVSKSGVLSRRTVSAMTKTMIEMDQDDVIIGIVPDTARYIEIYDNRGFGIAIDLNNYKYDKKVVNLVEDTFVSGIRFYEEKSCPDLIKSIVRNKISKTVRYK